MTRLDRFYTDVDVAKECWRIFREETAKIGIDRDSVTYIEPSAGSGSFFDLMPADRRIGLDLAPGHAEVRQADFLAWSPEKASPCVVVGNPPFGKRGATAVRFFRKAAGFADIIAFIVPAVFGRFLIQNRLPKEWRLISETALAERSFHLPTGKPRSVRTLFQIWTRRPSPHTDKRIRIKPPIAHPDFRMWQYNNTREAEKFFDREFRFGVPCQGWQDYSRRETDPGRCERTKQWMLFAAGDSVARTLFDMDFESLAYRQFTTVPGFRKADVVTAYEEAIG